MESIILRAPEPVDVDTMYRLENDRTVWPCGFTRAPMSRHLISEYVAGYSADPFGQGQLRLVIELDGVAVGVADLYDVDALNRRAGVGIVVEEAYRGKGIARESLGKLADYCGCELGLHQLYAVVAASNAPSRSLFTRCGYRISGCLRSWVRTGRSYGDAYIYQLMLV